MKFIPASCCSYLCSWCARILSPCRPTGRSSSTVPTWTETDILWWPCWRRSTQRPCIRAPPGTAWPVRWTSLSSSDRNVHSPLCYHRSRGPGCMESCLETGENVCADNLRLIALGRYYKSIRLSVLRERLMWHAMEQRAASGILAQCREC